MRPGQAAPEFAINSQWRYWRDGASMRPGQAAPEFMNWIPNDQMDSNASMRPGQAAPEFSAPHRQQRLFGFGFNEAGAGCPGIQVRAVPC